jgi:hypothetical protein
MICGLGGFVVPAEGMTFLVNTLFPMRVLAGVVVAILLAGCAAPNGNGNGSNGKSVPLDPRAAGLKLQNLDLANLVSPRVSDEPVALSAAKNEWASFTLQVSGLPPANSKTAYVLRLAPLNLTTSNRSIGIENLSAYQILSMPVDVNRAGYVRHTGLSASTRSLPRALLPMPMDQGKVNLSAARDPANPTDANARAGGTEPVMLWVDVHVPPETPAGDYESRVDVFQTGNAKPIASLPIKFTVYDFLLPDERHLAMVGQVEWESLQQLFPERFEALTDRLLNRNDTRYAPAIKTLDQLVLLAQAHRTQVVIPRLQPTVKWPAGKPPQVAWGDYDSVVTPWLKGDAFGDHVPLSFWPLPAVNGLSNYDRKSQTDYWTEAASHFDQNEWLARSAVMCEKTTPGRADSSEQIAFSAEAAAVLAAHPKVRACVPLEDDQVRFADKSNPKLVEPAMASRLVTSNPGIVFASPIKSWPKNVARPARWLRTDLTGLIPYVGAGGDERDVRLWAWLAFVPLPPPSMGVEYGAVQFIRWASVLPKTANPQQPADPNELIWFYPGSWFGIDEPLPTIQLKWLRRAQQDFEYLYLARQRGERINALVMSRLITKPVEIQPNQVPDQTFGLMSGTSDPKAWVDVKQLLAEFILLREPGQSVDKDKAYPLNLRMVQWAAPQERPVIMGRATGWTWDGAGGIDLKMGIDIYNASDSRPDQNLLAWTAPFPAGWEVRPQPRAIQALQTYHVDRFVMDAHLDPSRVRNNDRTPAQITFTNGLTNKTSMLKVLAPVATSDRREGNVQFDGALNDWSADDGILIDTPMVRMFNRPAIQSQELQPASTKSSVYTSWADENFYLAFKVSGLNTSSTKVFRNFVNYQFQRAWGEDLCQVIIQPVYADNTVGPTMHVACTPRGSVWVGRKMDPRLFADPWQEIQGVPLRYIASLDGADWRGEMSIPWKAINQPGKGMPVMLRFNFTQHRDQEGESASWAGPVDFGRDDAFTGLLILREPNTPGVVKN